MVVKMTVENAVQAKEKVESLEAQGYSHDEIYIFAHSKKRGDDITDALHTEEAGIAEQGFIEGMKNMFASRGDELRSKMEAVGLSTSEASEAEAQLDNGKLVIIASR